MASTSLTIHGAHKVTLTADVLTPEEDKKFAIMRFLLGDVGGEEIAEISAFNTKVITIEDTDNLDVFFATDSKGKTRLEISLPDSALDIKEDKRTDAKTLMAQGQ